MFKIRNCLNIDGQAAPLALFEPPIDPMALARAAAAGADVLSLFGGGAPISNYYRFHVLLDRARAFTDAVTQFGGALLDVLEKNDAAALDRLRSTQEQAILNLSTQSLEQQLKEQGSLIEAVAQQISIAEQRQIRFETLISDGLNAGEIADLTMLSASEVGVILKSYMYGLASPAHLIPTVFGMADGDFGPGDAVECAAKVLEGGIEGFKLLSEICAKSAEYERRKQEWEFEVSQAANDVTRLQKELAAAGTHLDIIQHQLTIHQQTIAQAEEYETFLKAKFTGQDLYQWMISRVSTVYNEAYHLALDLALKAQTAYQFELSSDDTFIQFDYWDSIHKGLVAGEGLTLALNQMEAAYLQNNTPGYQLEKEISLLHLDPQKFMEFKMGINKVPKGTLDFSLTEALFDSDFPSHYNRQIKAVSLSFLGAGIKGNAINATLVQTSSWVVLKAKADAVGYLINQQPSSPPDGTIRANWLRNQSVALSKKLDDYGLFALDFLFPDDQFYPFEGTGAVSNWTLTVPPENNRLAFDAISDIVVKLRYTSEEGGLPFGKDVKGKYQNPVYPLPLAKIIDVKATLGDEKWQQFVSPPADNKYSFLLPLADGVVITDIADVTLVSAEVVLNTASLVSDTNAATQFVTLTVGGGASQSVKISNSFGTVDLGTTPTADEIELELNGQNLPADLKLKSGNNLSPTVLKNIFIAVRFNSIGL
jgi:hypothetical protein